MDLKVLKKRIQRLTNYRELAQRLGWQYWKIAAKMQGFSPMREHELEEIVAELEKIKLEKKGG